MFLLVGLISGLRSVGASLIERSKSSGKFISGEFSKTRVLMYKRSWVTLSVTSRREISRRDVQISALCHVATWIFTSRRHFNTSLSRRDVYFHVATSKYRLSVTSRRGPARRDVIWSCPLPRRDVGFHVATWAYLFSVTSRRGTGFNPRIGHFWPFTAPTLSCNPSLPCTLAFTGPSEPLLTPVGDLSLARRPL